MVEDDTDIVPPGVRLFRGNLRHYDSHILTPLIPLRSAHDADENGDLIVYREPRHMLSAATNVMAKVWMIALRRLPLAIRRAQTRRDLSQQRCDRLVDGRSMPR
jgi:hypothetical protein